MKKSRLACWVDGPRDAPPVVLLHAIATNSDMWLPQLGVWSAAFRIVRIDLPGHGASDLPEASLTFADYAAQVREALDELEIGRVAIVGLSLGGMIAQAFALAYPERTRAVVLAHTSARTDPPVRELWDRRLEQLEQHGLKAQAAPTLERWFTRAFAGASPMTLEWLARQIRSTSAAGYAAAIRAIQALDHQARLPEISAPTLVVAGEDDSAVPPAVAAAIAQSIPRAELVVLKDAAHLGNVQQPVVFTEVVGNFLRKNLSLEQAT
jgi:3-oxoadipate enol-lactonase